MTMAGRGVRFAAVGYTVPKHRIVARGQSLFRWAMQSLRHFADDSFVFACLDTEDDVWLRREAEAVGIRHVFVRKRTSVSRGQAETAFDAKDSVSASEPLWIYNIDTLVTADVIPAAIEGFDGCLPVFRSSNPAMSFVRYGERDTVVEVAEKRAISQWATVGLYGFNSAALFVDAYQHCYASRPHEREFYVAPIYQHMLEQGALVCAPRLAEDGVCVLGTPDEVTRFDPSALPPQGANPRHKTSE